MDFDDSPREAAFRAEARTWLDAHAPAKGSPEDFSGGYLVGPQSAVVAACAAFRDAVLDVAAAPREV